MNHFKEYKLFYTLFYSTIVLISFLISLAISQLVSDRTKFSDIALMILMTLLLSFGLGLPSLISKRFIGICIFIGVVVIYLFMSLFFLAEVQPTGLLAISVPLFILFLLFSIIESYHSIIGLVIFVLLLVSLYGIFFSYSLINECEIYRTRNLQPRGLMRLFC